MMPTFLLPNQCNSFKGCLFDGASYTNSILSKTPFFLFTDYSFSLFSQSAFPLPLQDGTSFFFKKVSETIKGKN